VPALHIVLRYPPSSRERADSVARALKSPGRRIIRQEVDVPATETCGGEIYYNRDDFRSARSIQALLQPIAPLRISSFEVDDARLLIWLR
jgi:hypothetical protein